jgi:hypothetical protein
MLLQAGQELYITFTPEEARRWISSSGDGGTGGYSVDVRYGGTNYKTNAI